MEVFMDKNKLFNSMNYINQEWVEQAKPTRNKRVSLKKNKKYKVYRNIAAAAAVVFAVSGITYTGAYAYQKYIKPQSNVNFSSHIDDDSTVSVYSSNNMENSKNSTATAFKRYSTSLCTVKTITLIFIFISFIL